MKSFIFYMIIGFWILKMTTCRFPDEFDEFYDSEEGEELFLVDTASENSRSFAECYARYSTFEDFLRRDEYIALRATAISPGVDQEELLHSSDIDGVTIEWHNFADGLNSAFRHFTVLPLDHRSIKPFYPLIKKHVNRSIFTADSFRALKCSVGSQLIYDGHWETWIGFVPRSKVRGECDSAYQRALALNYMKQLKIKFQEQLHMLLKRKIAPETLSKNNLSEASRLFVLPGDQNHILRSFQDALAETELLELSNFRPMLLTFRFGEKIRTPLVLPVNNKDCVSKVCVHIGHNISDDETDLFWGRAGVQEVTGSHCIMTTVYSLYETANVQTLTDRSSLTLSPDLKAVCTLPNNINFFQLYTDLPHRYPKTRVNPVSASVMMMEGIITDVAQRKLYEEASTYISELRNNFLQCHKAVCRMEFVLELNDVPNEINACDYIRLVCLENLLASHAMIVPFWRKFSVLNKLRNVGLHLCDVLHNSLTTRRGTGDSVTVWTAFQAELACEKILWGRPLSKSCNVYSINLGPGLQYPTRCLTDQKGYLCLENCFSCCSDEYSLPPLNLFSTSVNVQQQIVKLNGLFPLIGGTQSALGGFLIRMFLKDCHIYGKVFTRFESFFLNLKKGSGSGGKRIVGGISAAELSEMIATARKYAWPFVFGAAKRSLLAANINIGEVLQFGLRHHDIVYFPALKNFDSSRNANLNWKKEYGYWVLTGGESEHDNIEIETAELYMLVLTELERRKLCHVSHYRDGEIFPWIKCVIEKTREKKFSRGDMCTILTFVSCIALIQSGLFIDFYALRRLVTDLPVTQGMLKMLQVQDKFRLPGMNIVPVYRLHSSIPISMKKKDDKKRKAIEKDDASESIAPQCNDDRVEQINPDDNVVALDENVETRSVHHVPSNQCFRKWSPMELSIVSEAESMLEMSLQDRYFLYQNLCRKAEIPDRSFQAYKKKVRRLACP